MADIVKPGESAGGPLNEGAMPANYNLEIYKGDYVELIVTVKSDAGIPVELDGHTAASQLKTNYDDSTPIDFDTAISEGVTGQVRIFLSSAVSSTLAPGDYIWDFQITNPEGNTRTYLTGDVVVYNEVTTP
jgi:hypothetical protein